MIAERKSKLKIDLHCLDDTSHCFLQPDLCTIGLEAN